MHRLYHGVQGRIEELLGRFGVKVAEKSRESEIRKQDGDLLAFADQDDAGREARLSQVGGV